MSASSRHSARVLNLRGVSDVCYHVKPERLTDMVLPIVLVTAATVLFLARLTMFAAHNRPGKRDN